MPRKKKVDTAPKNSPRIAHVNFHVEKERAFLKYVNYLSSPFHIMWRNFLAGTFRGLGFILGSAALLALIGFITSKVLPTIPFFSDFADAINIWIQNALDLAR